MSRKLKPNWFLLVLFGLVILLLAVWVWLGGLFPPAPLPAPATPTLFPTRTLTVTGTPSPTFTSTPTHVPFVTVTPTPTELPTITPPPPPPTETATDPATEIPTSTETPTETPTPTFTPTLSPSAVPTVTVRVPPVANGCGDDLACAVEAYRRQEPYLYCLSRDTGVGVGLLAVAKLNFDYQFGADHQLKDYQWAASYGQRVQAFTEYLGAPNPTNADGVPNPSCRRLIDLHARLQKLLFDRTDPYHGY